MEFASNNARYAPNDGMTYNGKPHSKLVQMDISDPTKCYDTFDIYTGNNHTEIPIVLIPGRGCNLIDCLIPGVRIGVSVPSGPYVLWQRWHEDQGELEPGVKWFWPFYNRISHIVSASAITYSAPARSCPTSDNVNVDVDLSLTFRIGPDVEAARKFVYRLGAVRMDEMLTAECEEGIRSLVYSVTHDKVNDLREEFATDVLGVLNEKFSKYGVQILNVKVTDVMLPDLLQRRLQETTAFKTKMGETEKVHENKVQVVKDRAILELETIRKENARKVREIQAETERFEIERRELELRAIGEARIQIVAEERVADVKLKSAQADEVISKIKARQKGESLLRNAEIACQRTKIEADEKAKVMTKDSEAELEVAKLKAVSMVTKEEVEMKGAAYLMEKRKYELEWSRLAILKEVAGKGRKFISAERGDNLINSMIPESQVA